MNALMKAAIVTLAITAAWYYLEYTEFGELQLDRHCDNVVSILYFLALWYLFANQN